MHRMPIYSKDQLFRIVSVPNGMWRLQHCTFFENGKPKVTRTSDPWESISWPIEFGRADALLKEHNTRH